MPSGDLLTIMAMVSVAACMDDHRICHEDCDFLSVTVCERRNFVCNLFLVDLKKHCGSKPKRCEQCLKPEGVAN